MREHNKLTEKYPSHFQCWFAYNGFWSCLEDVLVLDYSSYSILYIRVWIARIFTIFFLGDNNHGLFQIYCFTMENVMSNNEYRIALIKIK